MRPGRTVPSGLGGTCESACSLIRHGGTMPHRPRCTRKGSRMAGSDPLDLTRPNVARVCNYLLGGHGNFAADRELAGRLLEICPSLCSAARENREFLARSVAWAARQGIAQFADLGTGMPAYPYVGDAARAAVPDARIVYVDNDLMERAGVPVFPGHPVTDVISGAIRDNARESGPAAGRLPRGWRRSRPCPRGTAGGLSEVMGCYP